MDNETVFTLNQLIEDKLVVDAADPTATRYNGGKRTYYDRERTTIKVIFDMVIDHYDKNGDAVKMVTDIRYYVNLAGQPTPTDAEESNLPYNVGEPFYYLVSYEDVSAGLGTGK